MFYHSFYGFICNESNCKDVIEHVVFFSVAQFGYLGNDRLLGIPTSTTTGLGLVFADLDDSTSAFFCVHGFLGYQFPKSRRGLLSQLKAISCVSSWIDTKPWSILECPCRDASG